MAITYWYRTCPFCGQGRLFIYKNLNSGKLYLHCEECERGYYDPKKLDLDNSFLTLSENFDAIEGTKDDINDQGWNKFKLNELIEERQ